MLKKHQKALLALLNRNKDGFDFSSLSAEDWQAVFKESKVQAVCISAFDGTKNYMELIPNEIKSAWFNSSMQILLNNSRVEKAQAELVEILNQNRFSYIILKGLVSAFYYPDCKKRTLGDVDFLVHKEQQPKIEAVLENSGYKKINNDHPHHQTFRKNSCNVEMHFAVAGIPEGEVGEVFKDYLKSAITEYEPIGNLPYNSPSPKIHGVVILLHTLHHMLSEGLGLRHLCDWAYFVDKTSSEKFWKTDLLPLLKRTGTLNFAAIITKTAHLYLSTSLPDWAKDVDNFLCEQIIEELFIAGNLGKKDLKRAGSATLLSAYRKNTKHKSKIIIRFIILKNSMYYLYPFLHKWKIFYPFVFIWRIIRYLWLMLIGKRPNLIKANNEAEQRLSLYKQFQLYETTEE